MWWGHGGYICALALGFGETMPPEPMIGMWRSALATCSNRFEISVVSPLSRGDFLLVCRYTGRVFPWAAIAAPRIVLPQPPGQRFRPALHEFDSRATAPVWTNFRTDAQSCDPGAQLVPLVHPLAPHAPSPTAYPDLRVRATSSRACGRRSRL